MNTMIFVHGVETKLKGGQNDNQRAFSRILNRRIAVGVVEKLRSGRNEFCI